MRLPDHVTHLLPLLFLASQPSQAQQTSTVVVTAGPTTEVVIASTSTIYPSNATVTATTAPNPQYTNDLTMRTSVLNSTNFYRYEHGANFLLWNDTLADIANDWAQQCLWEHSHSGPGENLARGYPTVTESIDAWAGERSLYNFTGDQTGFEEATGHFTQLVWKSTVTVGCAAKDCEGQGGIQGWYLVCEYWPSGNLVATGSDPNEYFVQNVQAQVNGGAGFNVMSATEGATGVGTSQASLTGQGVPTSTAKNGAGRYVGMNMHLDGGNNNVWSLLGGAVGLPLALLFGI